MLTVGVENKSDRKVTLMSMAGSFHDPETDRVVKNVCSVFVLFFDHVVFK